MDNAHMSAWKIGFFVCAYMVWVSNYGEAYDLEILVVPRSTIRTGRATDRYPPPHVPTRASPNVHDEHGSQPATTGWTSWSAWSTCSSTTTTGFRIRNRVCPKEEKCRGDDVQFVKCNYPSASAVRTRYSRKYYEMCTKKYSDRLSCKLYLENRDLAYDIFRRNSCFFTKENGRANVENDTVAMPGNSNLTGRISEAEGDDEDNVVFSVDSTKVSAIHKRDPHEVDSAKEDEDLYRLNVNKATEAVKTCQAKCDETIALAAPLLAKGTQLARNLANTAIMLSRSALLGTGVARMFFEYNVCHRKCTSIQNTVLHLSGKPPRNFVSETTQQSVQIQRREIAQARRKRDTGDDGEVVSLCGGNPPPCSETTKKRARRRQKRQTSDDYESPCFSKEDRAPMRDIERKAGAQLFFFEDNFQRFTCRKCDGQRNFEINGLYNPKEDILQRRGDQPAFCRQGFLKRHGLFILDDPTGPHTFATGERFSIESRTFEIESHCEIVVRK